LKFFAFFFCFLGGGPFLSGKKPFVFFYSGIGPVGGGPPGPPAFFSRGGRGTDRIGNPFFFFAGKWGGLREGGEFPNLVGGEKKGDRGFFFCGPPPPGFPRGGNFPPKENFFLMVKKKKKKKRPPPFSGFFGEFFIFFPAFKNPFSPKKPWEKGACFQIFYQGFFFQKEGGKKKK